MKIYLLWFHEWEANNILGIFETFQDADRWRNYFLENHVDEDDDDYVLSSMTHFAGNNDLAHRLQIQECTVGNLSEDIKIDNLKLLEWEAKKSEEKNA